ncbi:hypothetical protein C8R44DRAFT_791055 [Mycena epipterygia]|nr:hypothetical protein C8R44DRAFT_791055 [Mycena epipterygia]
MGLNLRDERHQLPQGNDGEEGRAYFTLVEVEDLEAREGARIKGSCADKQNLDKTIREPTTETHLGPTGLYLSRWKLDLERFGRDQQRPLATVRERKLYDGIEDAGGARGGLLAEARGDAAEEFGRNAVRFDIAFSAVHRLLYKPDNAAHAAVDEGIVHVLDQHHLHYRQQACLGILTQAKCLHCHEVCEQLFPLCKVLDNTAV